ncbi:hypothetical protein LZ32DRAFT_674617 [Colletotrichum eremochloae]|nr:hypothetical protein LZ32DRAFT_674617 [Colletotrichum eremochloae]
MARSKHYVQTDCFEKTEGDILTSVQLSIINDAQLLACSLKDCLSANPKQVTKHLPLQHQIPAKRRKQATSLLWRSDLRLKEPSSTGPRPDGAPIDRRLRCYDGFLCDLCPFRTISKPMIVRHLGREHSQVTTVRFAKSSGTITSSYMPIYLQVWVRNPYRSQYFDHPQPQAAEEVDRLQCSFHGVDQSSGADPGS